MDIFKNLVPNSWRGWAVALVALVITFFYYYVVSYETILINYQKTFLPAVSTADSIQLKNVDGTVRPESNNILITIMRPENIAFSDFVERECVLRIENTGSSDVEILLTARGEPAKGEQISSLRIRSEANYESQEYVSAFRVEIPKYSVKEIPLYLSVERIDEKWERPQFHLLLYADGELLKFNDGAGLSFVYDPLNSFREFIIKFLLFPPFSNLFLISVVLFVVGGVENRKTSFLFYLASPQSWAAWRANRSGAKTPANAPVESTEKQDFFDFPKLKRDVSEIIAWLLCSGILFLSVAWFGWSLILFENWLSIIVFFVLLMFVIISLLLNVNDESLRQQNPQKSESETESAVK